FLSPFVPSEVEGSRSSEAENFCGGKMPRLRSAYFPRLRSGRTGGGWGRINPIRSDLFAPAPENALQFRHVLGLHPALRRRQLLHRAHRGPRESCRRTPARPVSGLHPRPPARRAGVVAGFRHTRGSSVGRAKDQALVPCEEGSAHLGQLESPVLLRRPTEGTAASGLGFAGPAPRLRSGRTDKGPMDSATS